MNTSYTTIINLRGYLHQKFKKQNKQMKKKMKQTVFGRISNESIFKSCREISYLEIWYDLVA